MNSTGMYKQGILKSEFARYALSRACVSAGLVLGVGSVSALANMHSARIFLSLQEMKEHWGARRHEGVFFASRASGVVSSALLLGGGVSPLFRAAEGVHLALECAGSAQQFWRVWAAAKRSSGAEIQKMLRVSGAALGCSAAEVLAVALGWWKLYLGVTVFRLSYSLYGLHRSALKRLKQIGQNYLQEYGWNARYQHGKKNG